MIPRFGAPPQPGRLYTRRPGVYALLPRNGALLLTHQAEPVPEYQLPGGGIDPGESAIPALHREVFEETGWRISRVRRVGVFRRFTFMPEYGLWAEKICAIYLALPTRADGPPSETGHTAVWMPVQDAARLLGNSGDRFFAGRLASGR